MLLVIFLAAGCCHNGSGGQHHGFRAGRRPCGNSCYWGMSFLTPVHVGAVVSCYCDVLETGEVLCAFLREVWINAKQDGEPLKVRKANSFMSR